MITPTICANNAAGDISPLLSMIAIPGGNMEPSQSQSTEYKVLHVY